MSYVKAEVSLLEYVMAYLKEEYNRSGHTDESVETLKQLVNEAIDAYAGGAR